MISDAYREIVYKLRKNIGLVRYEKIVPYRWIILYVVTIFIYAHIYYSCASQFSESFVCYWDALYYSGVTATSLGYGDIHPLGSIVRLVSVSETLICLIIMGVFIGDVVKSGSKKTDAQKKLNFLSDYNEFRSSIGYEFMYYYCALYEMDKFEEPEVDIDRIDYDSYEDIRRNISINDFINMIERAEKLDNCPSEEYGKTLYSFGNKIDYLLNSMNEYSSRDASYYLHKLRSDIVLHSEMRFSDSDILVYIYDILTSSDYSNSIEYECDIFKKKAAML